MSLSVNNFDFQCCTYPPILPPTQNFTRHSEKKGVVIVNIHIYIFFSLFLSLLLFPFFLFTCCIYWSFVSLKLETVTKILLEWFILTLATFRWTALPTTGIFWLCLAWQSTCFQMWKWHVNILFRLKIYVNKLRQRRKDWQWRLERKIWKPWEWP